MCLSGLFLPQPPNPFTVGEASENSGVECEVYDPAFMLPLLSHILDPGTGLGTCYT